MYYSSEVVFLNFMLIYFKYYIIINFKIHNDFVFTSCLQSIFIYVSLNFLEKQYFLNTKAYKNLYPTIMFLPTGYMQAVDNF